MPLMEMMAAAPGSFGFLMIMARAMKKQEALSLPLRTFCKLPAFSWTDRGNLRIEIIKTDGSNNELNIDDVTIYPYVANIPGDDDNMLMGNPSYAVTDTLSPDNYLPHPFCIRLFLQPEQGHTKLGELAFAGKRSWLQRPPE